MSRPPSTPADWIGLIGGGLVLALAASAYTWGLTMLVLGLFS